MAKPLILKVPVIAITGSAGKTTTKEMISAILSQRWNILKTKGNANAPRHTAMYAKRITSKHRAVVLEYGMSRHGQIKHSCLIVQPNIGIITNVGTAHIGNFNGNIKGIANTKSDLIRYMKQTGLLVLNGDDKNSKLLDTKNFKGKIIYVSQDKLADYKAENVSFERFGMSFETKIKNKVYQFYIPVYGKHNIYNALSAIAVANYLGFTPLEIKKGLRSYRKPYRRLTVYKLKNNVTIIDDTFSANPNAVKAAIDVMSIIGKGKRIAVLGTMLEMGKYKIKGHIDVGRYVGKRNVDILYTYGYDAKHIAQGALQAGLPKKNVKSFVDQNRLFRDLIQEIKPNTTILFKASHGMELNRPVKRLLNYYGR